MHITHKLFGSLAWLACMAALPALAAPPGDATRGRALLLDRQESGCILCHVLPGLPQGGAGGAGGAGGTGGTIGPALTSLGQRYTRDDLTLRIADARRSNPDTIMPPYFSTEGLHNVARAQAGKTVLSEQALADIVAYLLAPPVSGDGSR